MKRTLHTLSTLIGLTLSPGTPVLAAGFVGHTAGAVQPATFSRTISGTVTAAGDHSLRNTVILACPGGDCESESLF